MLLKLLSKLPLNLLYLLAGLIYLIVYYVVRYRRPIVFDHIRTAFPKMSEKEVRRLAKRFYRNLADITVEIIKGISISGQELEQRTTHKNLELIHALADQGQSFVLLSSHAGNWEWLQLAVGMKMPIPMGSVYKPLHNRKMDQVFFEMRSRFGATLIEATEFMDVVVKNRKKQLIYAILADQKPRGSAKCHVTEFLNRETRFFTGPEKVAQFARAPVVFVHMTRLKRGYYEIEYELIAEPPYQKQKDYYPITESYARAVEKHILQYPDSWLWSNRRWRVRRAEKSVA